MSPEIRFDLGKIVELGTDMFLQNLLHRGGLNAEIGRHQRGCTGGPIYPYVALLPRQPGSDPARWPDSARVLVMASDAGQKVLRPAADSKAAGTIRPGHVADLAVIAQDPDGYAPGEVGARLVLGPTNRTARHVVAGGRVLMRDGRLTTLDEAALDAALRQIAAPSRTKEHAA